FGDKREPLLADKEDRRNTHHPVLPPLRSSVRCDGFRSEPLSNRLAAVIDCPTDRSLASPYVFAKASGEQERLHEATLARTTPCRCGDPGPDRNIICGPRQALRHPPGEYRTARHRE